MPIARLSRRAERERARRERIYSVSSAIRIDGLSFSYGQRRALHDLDLELEEDTFTAFLGPNGSGKTTLFRILATLLPCPAETVTILGWDLAGEARKVRRQLGVVFQNASIDRELTVDENLRCHAALYGLQRSLRDKRIVELAGQLGLTDRLADRAGRLSGGLQRRTELAKGLLHCPTILLLDEPTSGLDPAARRDFWAAVGQMRSIHPLTVLATTHLVSEADRADRVAILDRGQLVEYGAPDELKADLGSVAITVATGQPQRLASALAERFGVRGSIMDETLRIHGMENTQWIPDVLNEFGDLIREIRVAHPTLEDVFLRRTGHSFTNESWQGQ